MIITSACTTHLDHLSEWFEKLCLMGPKYGYYPELKKTVLIVDKEYDSEAHAKFDHLGVKVERGHRFLGGFIGDVEATNQFVKSRTGQTLLLLSLTLQNHIYRPLL